MQDKGKTIQINTVLVPGLITVDRYKARISLLNSPNKMTTSTFAKSSDPKKVAIIGGGVSGLACAWHLHTNCSPDVHVEIFEAADRLGGHAHTLSVFPSQSSQPVDVDIGFMVFNDANYPNMTSWFQSIGIQVEDTDMSLSVSLDGGKTEWSSIGLDGLLANKTQIFRPSFYRFIRDMLRFNQEAGKILALALDDPRRQVTTKQYLRQEGYSEEFATHYLLPMMAALWSASMGDVLNFPAAQLIGFMCNHKMLQIFDRPKWNTVAGRSKQYTEKMHAILGDSRVHLSSPVTAVKKIVGEACKYEIYIGQDKQKYAGDFDEVVFACHAPRAVDILQDEAPCDVELLELLGKIQYEDNIIYVHSDTSLMPKRKAAWASWNCLGKSDQLKTHTLKQSHAGEAFEGGDSGFGNKLTKEKEELEGENGRMKAVYVTYHLNRLQNLNCDTDILVSLNPHRQPDSKLVYKKQIMAHPQFTPQTLQARDKISREYQGKNGLWFCGAWQGYGFHEDGCRGGFEVATAISNVPLPWCVNSDNGAMVLAPPNLIAPLSKTLEGKMTQKISKFFSYTLPTVICKWMVLKFMKDAIKKGRLNLKMNDGSLIQIGDGTPCGCDDEPVTLRVFDEWFFVKIAMEYDLGLARSYMSGFFNVEPLNNGDSYDQVIRPANLRNEANVIIGDPVGLTRLFHLFIGNRDSSENLMPKRSIKIYNNALTNAAGLLLAKVGATVNFVRYRLTMDNSERGGSLKNIHAHYDLSNDLFRTFLDKKTLMYSSAIYDAVKIPSSPTNKLAFRGSLEDAEVRKLDTLLDRAQVKRGQTLLDIGFGWGGLSLHAAKKYGCRVTGITLSVEQKALAEERVRTEGVEDLITFEVVDYRTFARRKENRMKFDRVLSCEMIEAVGHDHLGEFFWAVEQVLHPQGVLVMEAITTPESRYENYLRTTDFINTIIFPGSCCPSLHALVDASYKWSSLTLEHIDNIGIHYAETLREWRRRFNASEDTVRALGFDDVFMRVWNYYLTYCEAGFDSQTENCLILVFSRPGCNALIPLCETRSVTQMAEISADEYKKWLE